MHQPKTLARELPEVEDGENTVLLLWLLVKAENDPSNTQTLSENKCAAILAKEYTSQNSLGAWDSKSGRSLEATLVDGHEISERCPLPVYICGQQGCLWTHCHGWGKN